MQQHEIWSQIPIKKNESIYKASIEEFAEYGYQQASTNRIIKKAGVSKGLLFHYFGNKKQLYLSLLDVILSRFVEYFHQSLQKRSPDIFLRISNWSKQKLQMFFDFPLESKILMDTFLEIPYQLKDDLSKRFEVISKDTLTIFLSDIDYSLFRFDIEPQKAIELIMTTMDGLANKYIRLYNQKGNLDSEDLKQSFQEVDDYLYMLKVGLYPLKENH
ncbi:TetR/AcrR family transcriptional regulator [Tepidibacillus marianensis]|uniref:TetR/AcrR family transcriptional regulator n=1 Tax=Tepidibacillus marianensis TaxID=3131995 RepID=UPI0030CF1EE0